ncbi:hypothetical protein Sjap_010714 [Stephania japonica]|uniref:DUF2470 domain-containing protein n=1 Tax=Stephania japonica TaxID=461633 RepID=A0AAP0J9P0_9MAGN
MIPTTQSLSPPHIPSLIPTNHFNPPIPLSNSTLFSIKTTLKRSNFSHSRKTPVFKSSFQTLKCSVSVVSEPAQIELKRKPSPAEVSRTVMEVCELGTLCTLSQEGWPVGSGVRFAVDAEGTPVLCLNAASRRFSMDRRASILVQLKQCGSRITHCMVQGSLEKPDDRNILKKLHSIWRKKFNEEIDADLIYTITVEKVLQKEGFEEDGAWATSSEYKNANPDPLRDCAENIVKNVNNNHMEDFERICNIFVDPGFQVISTKLIWVDRLGFDVQLYAPEKKIFEARIPFPREVTDEKGVKSSLNIMSQLAWEVERNHPHPEFEKGEVMKQVR